MTNFVQVLKMCEGAEGEGKKKVILGALGELDSDGRKLMHYAMNPYQVFGIRKTDKIDFFPEDHATQDPTDLGFLFDVLDKLAARELTGNAARMKWSEVLTMFTPETALYIERIIDKDPRGGFSAATFNKVWPEEKIPTFEVQLADKCDDTEDFEKHVSFPAWAAVKYDGNRNLAFVRNVDGELRIEHISRQGKPADHLNGLFDADLHLMYKHLGYDFVADGEAFASDFTETQNAKKAGNTKAKDNLRFRLFFVMPLTEWMAQESTITTKQNLENCMNMMNAVALERGEGVPAKIIFEDGKMVSDYQEMMTYCNEVVDAGDEGLIVKDMDSVYTWDRTYAWTKVKRFYDVDATIIGVYKGKKKSRLENTLGGVVIAGYLESGELVVSCVGSGFSDAQRDEIWNNKEKYQNQTIVVKYQETSKAKNKTITSLRFCTVERFRDDKLVEIKDTDMEGVYQEREALLKKRNT